MVQQKVLSTVLLAGFAALVAVIAARLYSRKLMTDVTDLMEGLELYVKTTVRGE